MPRITPADGVAAGSTAAAAATVRVRATRAKSTSAAARRAVRQVREFAEANPPLAGGGGDPTHDTYDIVVEAFVFAEAAGKAGQPCPWTRARRPQDASAARAAGSARSLLEQLGWSRGGEWRRSRAMAVAWGVRDETDARQTEPIFTWELVNGLRLRRPVTPWEMAGAAMAVVGALHGKRGGGARKLKVGEVIGLDAESVRVAARTRGKLRARATGKAQANPKGFVLRHWLVRHHLMPWLEWHQRHQTPGSGLLFPSITGKRSPKPTPLGFCAEGHQWVEPLRTWSDRQVRTWLQQFIPALGQRGFHGLRAGNNRELRRSRDVHDVTRRALHERSLKPLLGSEAHYDEPFAEDFAEATQCLGRLRIERDPATGLLSVTATSASAGERNDWVVVPRPVALTPAAAEGESSSDDSSSAGGSDSSGEAPARDVVGEGDRATRKFDCGRCGARVGDKDYGFVCDVHGCNWGTCTTCHPGGTAAPLLCPGHSAMRGGGQ